MIEFQSLYNMDVMILVHSKVQHRLTVLNINWHILNFFFFQEEDFILLIGTVGDTIVKL